MTSVRTYPDRARGAAGAGAFSLVELLVVVAVLLVLVALVAGLSGSLARNSRVNQTKNLLQTLDRALSEFVAVMSAPPPYTPDDYTGVPGQMAVRRPFDPACGASGVNTGPEMYLGAPHVRRPDAAVFLRQVSGFGEVNSIIAAIPEQFLRVTPGQPGGGGGGPGGGGPGVDVTPSVVDAWAAEDWSAPWDMTGLGGQQLVYYVHPDNALAQDLYGKCVNSRPYFVSAGPDKHYGLGGGTEQPCQAGDEDQNEYEARIKGALDDNIYSYDVGPARLDDAFFPVRNLSR